MTRPSEDEGAAKGRTKATMHCGIVLHPAGHTRSPAMHNAAYRALGLDAHYEAYDVLPSDLARAVDDFRRRALRQWAVSIPHKESMLELVDEVEPVARAIGAINTVTRVGERLVGTNTDWIGALRALERIAPISGQRAVVLGAGGTARALVYGSAAAALRGHGLESNAAHAPSCSSESWARTRPEHSPSSRTSSPRSWSIRRASG